MTSPLVRFKTFLATGGLVLGCLALWSLVPDLVRPNKSLASGSTPRAQLAGAQMRARIAANIGLIRGDLWSQFAQLEAASTSVNLDDVPAAAKMAAQRAGRQAVTFAPIDGRIWLLLANLNAVADNSDPKVTALLKMSFFTAPNDLDLIPRRLLLAARSDSLVDEDVQTQVEQEIRSILANRPTLKPAITAAYKAAQPRSKRVFDDILQNLDPEFLSSMGRES
jgi:hypothetical protein